MNFKVFSGILIALLILGVISSAGASLLGKVEATGVRALVANASGEENANSPLIDVETFPNSGNVAIGNVEKARIAEHKITQFELEELKSRVGVYVKGRDYNQLINGYGTGLRPPTDDEWAKIAESAYVVDSVTYPSSPPSVDQSAKPWFPPIGNQDGEGSCTAWAVGYYVKTFQEAKEHAWNFSGAAWEGGYSGHPTLSYQNRIISPDFIYHLINNGVDSGSFFNDAIQLVCFIGACSWEKMPYNPADHTTWPSEEAWTEAPLYRGNSSGYQYMSVNTDSGLANLKNWIASDHLAIIGVDADKYSGLTSADMWTLDNYVNPSVNHANTIVGYDNNVTYTENGQLRYGAFKIANSWGVGGWENVNDGFYWISYEAMKQRVGYCMFYYDLVGYKPELAATFRISHDKRNECGITVGLGNPSAPIITKTFSQYIFGGSVPFCSNNILFDITEFKNYVSTIYDQLYFLKVYDGGTSTVGTISKFAVEYADSIDAPRQTVNGNYVYMNVTLPPLETDWTEEMLVNSDQDSLDQKIAMATDSSGNMYVAYADRGSLNQTAIFVRKSSDGGATWPFLMGASDSSHDLGYPSIAIDPYNNEIYVAFEREWASNDHDIWVLRFVNGTWSCSPVANTLGSDDRFPSVTCEYQLGSSNWQYISYEYVYNSDDRDLMFAKSTDHGATWSIRKLHGAWPDGNVHAQTSITNAEGNIYIAYKWGADYNSLCEIRVERSTDFGGTWTQFSDVDGLPNDCQFPSIAATHGGDAVVIGFQYKWSASDVDIWYSYSTNKGSTWTKGQPLFTSGLEDEKSLALVVDGEGTQTQDVRGYIHAVCKVGRYAEYTATNYSQLTNWSVPKTISDGWVGKGLAITVRPVNDTYYPNAAWTDARTKNIYFSTSLAYVQPNDFNVSASPSSQTVTAGSSSSYSVTVSSVSGSPQNVSLSCSPSITGVAYSFSPSFGNPTFSSTFTVQTSTSTPANTYTLNITGTGGGQTHSTTVQLNIISAQWKFDFGTDSSPVETGYTGITSSSVYSSSIGFGWDTSSGLGSRDRGGPDNLKRDLVFGSSDHTFNVDLANSYYNVTLVIGDNGYAHDLIDVYAEGVLQVNHLTVGAGTFSTQIFNVTVNDGQLNLKFHDAGGTDVNWVINAITIQPVVPTVQWTFMVYMDGDNNLESYAWGDFNEMEAATSNAAVNIVVQFDRIPGYFASSPDWSTTRRYLVTHDTDTTNIHSTMIQDLGELNMGDPATLVNFVEWAINNYPAQHYALVLWDHGSGWRSEDITKQPAIKGVCYDDTSSGNGLTMQELRNALNQVSIDTGVKLDILGYDACFMGMLEVDYQTRQYANYRVGSEETEPEDGWAYNATLGALTSNPAMTADNLAGQIVSDYFIPYGTSGEETMSAVNLTLIENVKSAVDSFAQRLILDCNNQSRRQAIATCRSNTQQYYDPDFVDLYHFAMLVNQNLTLPSQTRTAANTLMTAINNYVTEEMHGSASPGSHGLSIYFPDTSQSYETDYGNLLFAQDTHWDEFLLAYRTPSPTAQQFDFGTASSPVESGYVQVTESTAYSAVLGYGWDSAAGLGSRDRGGPDNLRRDFIFSSMSGTFKVDLSNGTYLVMVVVGDQSFMHDNIYVYAEGVLRAVISVKAGEFLQRVFTVSVTDGALDLTLVDAGGSDSNWVINALIVEQYTERKFDFGTDSSAVEAGYTQVLSTTLYSEDTGFGWVDTMGLYSRDRGVPDALRRDFVFSSSNRTFRVDVPNGKYMVQVIVGDNAFSHDNIYVYAEGALVVGNLTVEAGRFAEVVFYVEVWDGHLELTFIDGGGKDANWVVNCIYVKSAVTLNFEFDFGTNSSLVEAGFLRVAENTVYSPSIGYGWSAIANLQSRDRGAPDALRRDFVFSSGDGAFNLDVPNGKYQVTLIIGDMNYMHDKMDVYAEGTLMISDLNVSSGTFKEVTFTVSVNDCQLNMVFHDGGGVDSNWVINALSVEALV